jgi:hypothetical protein
MPRWRLGIRALWVLRIFMLFKRGSHHSERKTDGRGEMTVDARRGNQKNPVGPLRGISDSWRRR